MKFQKELLRNSLAFEKKGGWRQENFAVFIDGGVRRGGDIFKAVALGAQERRVLGAFASLSRLLVWDGRCSTPWPPLG